MNDQVGRLKRLDEFTVSDLECVRLILRGDSVIDWHRLHIETDAAANAVIEAQELRPDDPADAARIEHLKREAISYLRRHFEFPIPRPIEQASPQELLLVASTKGHRQICACTVLKAMHIMHHLDGRELLFMLPLSDQEVFHLVEEKVYRVIGGMLAAGFPITEFVGGRKNKDSLYTKLLSKQDTIAAAIYDKLRFRIVTRSPDDLLSVLLYLSQRLFPFNYVIPGESVNTIFHFKSYCERNPHLRPMLSEMQAGLDDDLTPGDNRFSAENYRTIHLVVDLPVRLPQKTLDLAPASAKNLGPIVYVLCEFQLIDQDTEASNEQGEASHARYKERQKEAVMRRLKLGTRQMRLPPSIPPAGSVPPEHIPVVRAPLKSVPPPRTGGSSGPKSVPPTDGRSGPKSVPPTDGRSGPKSVPPTDGRSGPKSVPPPRSGPPSGPKSVPPPPSKRTR